MRDEVRKRGKRKGGEKKEKGGEKRERKKGREKNEESSTAGSNLRPSIYSIAHCLRTHRLKAELIVRTIYPLHRKSTF